MQINTRASLPLKLTVSEHRKLHDATSLLIDIEKASQMVGWMEESRLCSEAVEGIVALRELIRERINNARQTTDQPSP